MLESFVVSSCRPHLRPNLSLTHRLILFSTDGLQRHGQMADRREEQRTNMHRSGGNAGETNLIQRLRRDCYGEHGVKAIGQWPEHHVGKQDRSSQDESQMQSAKSRQHTDRGGAPDGRRGVEAAYISSLLEDDA